MHEVLFLAEFYDGSEGPLFSSMVSSEVFSEFDIALRIVKQFQEIFRQFLEVLNSPWKSQAVLGSLKQFSQLSNSSRKSYTVPGSFKQFLELSNSSQNS